MPPEESSATFVTKPRISRRDTVGAALAAALLAAYFVEGSLWWRWDFYSEFSLIAAGVFLAVIGFFAWLVHGVTIAGAFVGIAIGLILATAPIYAEEALEIGLTLQGRLYVLLLVVVFVLTWLATRVHRARERVPVKQKRDGLQVFANLGAAGLLAGVAWISPIAASGVLAIFAELAADTVSSEIGQAIGSQPRLITRLKRTSIGTNGAISLAGTVAGICAATIVIGVAGLVTAFSYIDIRWLVFGFIGAIAGMFFDSLLGATLEGRWLNNDGVNFLSTCFAAAVADGLFWLTMRLH